MNKQKDRLGQLATIIEILDSGEPLNKKKLIETIRADPELLNLVFENTEGKEHTLLELLCQRPIVLDKEGEMLTIMAQHMKPVSTKGTAKLKSHSGNIRDSICDVSRRNHYNALNFLTTYSFLLESKLHSTSSPESKALRQNVEEKLSENLLNNNQVDSNARMVAIAIRKMNKKKIFYRTGDGLAERLLAKMAQKKLQEGVTSPIMQEVKKAKKNNMLL